MTDGTLRRGLAESEDAVLDAALRCSHRLGFSKVTIDDICRESGVSRATVYRLFPGGRDVLFEALRVRELHQFFGDVVAEIEGATTVEAIVVRSVVSASILLKADDHLAMMLSSEPGEALGQLTAAGLPRIIRMATGALAPHLEPLIGHKSAHRLIDLVVRLTVSHFLSPDESVDLTNAATASQFLYPLISSVTLNEHSFDSVMPHT
ncbi:MAG: TetR/AcrR family transcriptional regulator [Actinobacteria bacterium]|nr:TetR/AcrR family transcriptional regulator [Ilumatobacteraceae bacterium]MDA0299667.1 TetR/AcrR family transcriptional regulator [Actinomycetota bacterium]MDA2961041.1 TetR/AcrR family transcriptional regulator [Actinomycetota bacterium]MDA2994515.1 TetR/AcrR family transcriptional regulator [Actinomycetota bacterium]